MIHLICKRLLHTRPLASTWAHGFLYSSSSRKPTSDFSNSTYPQSPTITYLVNSCGLSLESAVSTSRKLEIGPKDQLDSVLNLLKSIGLSQSHIKNLVVKRPMILVADAKKSLKPNVEVFGSLGFFGANLVKLLIKEPRILETDAHATVEFFRAYGFTKEQIFVLTMKLPVLYLFKAPQVFKPKLEYFKSLGFSDAEISQILASEPYILARSLENWIIPSVQVIRRVVGTNENVLKVLKACYRILDYDLQEIIEPNIAVLVDHGVPESLALRFLMYQPSFLLFRTRIFSEVVEEVEKLGFDPMKMQFLLAVHSLARISKSLRQRKLETFQSFGMSEDQVLSAFKRQPMFMLTSEKKIRKLMGFFVNELKLSPSAISKTPGLMQLSFEKRIAPRCSVLQVLMSKGAIKGNFSLFSALKMVHKKFEEKYVIKYHNVIPAVVEAHQGKIKFQGFSVKLKA